MRLAAVRLAATGGGGVSATARELRASSGAMRGGACAGRLASKICTSKSPLVATRPRAPCALASRQGF
eukprot:3820047-Prymnesium_polylepis.1